MAALIPIGSADLRLLQASRQRRQKKMNPKCNPRPLLLLNRRRSVPFPFFAFALCFRLLQLYFRWRKGVLCGRIVQKVSRDTAGRGGYAALVLLTGGGQDQRYVGGDAQGMRPRRCGEPRHLGTTGGQDGQDMGTWQKTHQPRSRECGLQGHLRLHRWPKSFVSPAVFLLLLTCARLRVLQPSILTVIDRLLAVPNGCPLRSHARVPQAADPHGGRAHTRNPAIGKLRENP